ncbi:MAG: histone deacetylase [Solirubrobacteraceae bacterium]|jgi:acetoin utilization deacetylase AcuC-like enzyme
MASCVFFSHPASAGHDTGAHPERRERIVAIERHLEQTGWSGFERRDAPRVEREVLETCHDAGYVAALERLCAVGGGQIDEDTVVSSGSFEAAMRAAGGAVAVVDVLLSGEAVAAFSAGRPPGHHALRARAGGFCLFNNIAVATLHALSDGALERVLIFDWDVHHGNGTNDLFHSSPAVLYVSIHEAPLYPGSGLASDRGSGAGEGFTLNLPVPAFSGDDVFCELVHERVIPLARDYRPQLIMISAGYDAHAEDPLADCLVSEAGFATMTTAMRRLGEELEAPVGVVLEGGYELGALARSVAATLQALSAGHV